MKLPSVLALFFPFTLAAQNLVDQLPHARTALLEEFTGLHCGNCPAGHADAAAIEAEHGSDVVIVALHAGSLAVPNVGEPDFRNEWADALLDHYGVTSTPRGVVNRRSYNGQLSLTRTLWSPAVDAVLDLPSPVNLGVASAFDPDTRLLTVQAELYYTADGSGGNDFISVLLTEDHIIGWQTDYLNGNHTNYDHTHVLRAYLTELWGDEVTTTTQGSTVARTYTFTVPDEFNADNCNVVAFVGEHQGEVYVVKEVEAIDGTTVGISEGEHARTITSIYPQPATEVITVEMSAAEEDRTIEIVDATGRIMAEGSLKPNVVRTSFDVQSWPSGWYLCRISGMSGVHVQRLVVAH